MVRSTLLAVSLALSSSIAVADIASSVPVIDLHARAIRRSGAVAVDGTLDEAAWQTAPKQSGFTQRTPKDGAKAAFDTSFAVLYDDDALYVGVWATDPDPSKIGRVLARRDVELPSMDVIAIAIDSYHDRRTAYVFQLNAASVQRDMVVFDDVQSDDTWDAVWTGEAAIHATGWCAEFRIPLNQLRYPRADKQEWGFQVVRIVSRTQEQTAWSPWPRSSDQVVSRFGVLDGIGALPPKRRLELLPYVTGGFEAMPVDSADPLNDGFAGRGNLGLDVKYGLGPAFTLSATLNPDFGQVEADPSQVNLSGNELFFAERRPFFLEGVDLFKLQIGNSDGSPEGAFYSRRIGAGPTVVPDGDYLDAPTATTIYSAAKVSGKTRGWSLGILDAVTAEETATVQIGDVRQEPVVAPLTNYMVGRLKRDLRGGRTSVGLSATAVHRALDGTGLGTVLHDQAYTAGAQVAHRWDKNAWQLDLRLLGSYVHGSEDAIARTQRSQRHLYQRPDARSYHFDDTRTSLTGGSATWKVGRMGDTKHWRFFFGGDVRTSGLELNDAGFQLSSDRAIPFIWGQYHDEDPGKSVLNYQINSDVFIVADEISSDPRMTDLGLECNANAQLANYWQLGAGCNINRARWQPGALRGGPSLRVDPYANGWVSVQSDARKPVYVSFNGWAGRNWNSDSIDGGFDIGLNVQARANIDVFVGPSWNMNSGSMQYVETAMDTLGQPHYVTARIRQETVAMTARVNWTFSPRLTLQAYAQPFIATGRYSDFKDVVRPAAAQFEDRFERLDIALAADGRYVASSGDAMFSFDKPDFNFRQLRSTVVLRWEYRPGSNIFAIWSHGRTSVADDGRYDPQRDLGALGDAEGENIVMVKANYWIGF